MNREQELAALDASIKGYDLRVLMNRGFILLIELSVRLLGLKRTEHALQFFLRSVRSPGPSEEAVLIDFYVTMFNRIKLNNLMKGRCLAQSLAMRFLLQRKGITTELKIGVSMKGGFTAHAWLEKDGQVLNDHPSAISEFKLFSPLKIRSTLKFT